MRLTDAITRTPIPFEPRLGQEAAAPFADLGDLFRDLVAGAAGSAPHLAHLVRLEGEWLHDAAQRDPGAVLTEELAALDQVALPDLAPALRRAKRRVGLLTALADLGGAWGLDDVTGALSDLADRALSLGVSRLVSEAQAANRLPQVEAADGGLFILAMGKLGARELNYSSDIDLIALFDESLYPADAYPEIRKQFIRITQALAKLIGEETGDGYVFRTDLRLRPDPSVTPVCIGMGAAERYYESQGRTWERAAYIRARICAGDQAAGARFLEDLTPFIWRRHLDFAAIEDAHEMRRRIREHKGLGGPFQLPGHNVKLGRGGIREIEFFVQTKQLICGGRDPALRVSRTLPALDALVDSGWIPGKLARELGAAYVAHRTLEHRLQMLEDAQTHAYPTTDKMRDRLAAFCGAPDRDAFEAGEAARFGRVHVLAEGFFAPDPEEADPDALWAAFPDPEETRALVEAWLRLPALKTERARGIFRRIAPKIASRLGGAADPHGALMTFDRFLRGLPAGVQVFSLFEANPHILDLLVDICATAPRLADYLGRNAAVLDAVLAPGFFDPLAGVAELEAELDARLDAAEGYEGVLDAARIWGREQSFRVGVMLLRRIATPEEGAVAYSALAEAVLRALLPRVIEEHSRRYGPPPGGGMAVLAMGKLGSGEMTARSDLDVITVYDATPDMESAGPKALSAPAYYARLTQALVSALTVPTAEGALYQVDMRLRPSGRQGPVATSLTSFAAYQREQAWTWEHLALTRARVIAGPPDLERRLASAVDEALAVPRDRAQFLAETREMRARLAAAREAAGRDPWEVKDGPGRLLDIELALQAGKVLCPGIREVAPRRMIAPLVKAGWLTEPEGKHLSAALRRLSALQQITRLSIEGRFDPSTSGPGLAQLAAAVTGASSVSALKERLLADAERSAAIVARVLEG
ncbi:bifunctional [glutamine synthetase] adenylyltransferase/[glutamine synthetase]-adenylyl-L-tyrosine phosphorylase [Halovulum dunhuangense]|uniref:Bifunctional [glutamine synthetase] adenylyltransferase/[glutamine synthetase]-adenylyl-L-tyrosine phosphorylase n=1 Tax=Halovulum dunhuangense TaxID=1505036 RepID=A0A849L2W0_9RHOB|nr:bifunctional [glutamine synthetase] adenylyltransferase/[glutamine synthetase]-adenylyl-L-tyrosine phosphorylase [Halovulum dunhuangense]NNU80570.1 bifunctional [glutamine synthetase] adenylyltransferase/[glutamine synthetase]-adenylyl-L-tyrosine phosphorylase [Halovulum dunhuangense]